MTETKGPPVPSHPLRWFPELWELGRKRLQPQARLLGLSLVVGVVAGVGAIVFYLACQVVVHFALNEVAGYRPNGPGNEPQVFAGEGELPPAVKDVGSKKVREVNE